MPLQVHRAKCTDKLAKLKPLYLQAGRLQNLQSSPSMNTNNTHVEERARKRQLKLQAEARAAQPLDPDQHLKILYFDSHICVTNKPSGILSVPGVRGNPSLAGLVHDALVPNVPLDQMIVHRLDMDTSGLLVFALTEDALTKLHHDFRSHRVRKTYHALLCGHWGVPASTSSASLLLPRQPIAMQEMEVDIALERDPNNPPFMRVAQTRSLSSMMISNVHPSFQKYLNQAPKPALTEARVLAREYLFHQHRHDTIKIQGQHQPLPVTRVELSPRTGRTHQLRVHMAALGYPIVGDDIYGYMGEGDCGVDFSSIQSGVVNTNSEDHRIQVQHDIYQLQLPLCLHAQSLSFRHPVTGGAMLFECSAPF